MHMLQISAGTGKSAPHPPLTVPAEPSLQAAVSDDFLNLLAIELPAGPGLGDNDAAVAADPVFATVIAGTGKSGNPTGKNLPDASVDAVPLPETLQRNLPQDVRNAVASALALPSGLELDSAKPVAGDAATRAKPVNPQPQASVQQPDIALRPTSLPDAIAERPTPAAIARPEARLATNETPVTTPKIVSLVPARADSDDGLQDHPARTATSPAQLSTKQPLQKASNVPDAEVIKPLRPAQPAEAASRSPAPLSAAQIQDPASTVNPAKPANFDQPALARPTADIPGRATRTVEQLAIETRVQTVVQSGDAHPAVKAESARPRKPQPAQPELPQRSGLAPKAPELSARLEAAAQAPAAPRALPTAPAPVRAALEGEAQQHQQQPAPTSPPVLSQIADARTGVPTAPTPSAQPAQTANQAGPHEFSALVDKLAEAREAASPQTVRTALRHDDFGLVNLRFVASDARLNVTLTNADPGFAPAVQAANSVAQAQASASAENGQNGGPRHDAHGQQQLASGSNQTQSQRQQAQSDAGQRDDPNDRQSQQRPGSNARAQRDAKPGDPPAWRSGIFA